MPSGAGGGPGLQVRRLAAAAALPNTDRRDSQGICFLGKVRAARRASRAPHVCRVAPSGHSRPAFRRCAHCMLSVQHPVPANKVRRLCCRGHVFTDSLCIVRVAVQVKFPEFVREHLGEWPGPILEAETGRPLGSHAGYWFYTVGQRGGIKLPGGPWCAGLRAAPNSRAGR